MKRGFTLIEVMIAMGVLLIGILAMAPVLSMSIERGTHARKLSTAQHLAEEILERLRLEIRYDANPPASTFSAADAWKYDVLPHATNAAAAGADCQPAGFEDGFTYDYGPYLFSRADQTYRVCYSLTPVDTNQPRHANLPPTSAEVRVRVLWRGLSGWSSWSISDLLVGGV